MPWQEFIVTDKEKGYRLDQVLALKLPEYSRVRLQGLIKDGQVLVDGKTSKPHHKLRTAENVTLEALPSTIQYPPSSIQPEKIPLDIVYEDESIIVVNKPVGMVTHPAPGNWSGTLVNAILGHCTISSGDILRPGIVHRLDKDTSGLLIVAKNESTHLNLAQQLKNRQLQRKYIALVEGIVEFDEGTVNAPIGRHPHDRKKMAVIHNNTARHAITHYRVLKRLPKQTLLEISLETGRTHQIRVHMAHIGHPIVGDSVYGRRLPYCADRMMLHAFYLGFKHPLTNKLMEFKTDYDMILDKT